MDDEKDMKQLQGLTFTIANRDKSWTHPGSQAGKLLHGQDMRGFSRQDLDRLEAGFRKRGLAPQRFRFIELLSSACRALAGLEAQDAELLVIPEAVDHLLEEGASEELFVNLLALQFNEKNIAYGRKVRRHAQQSVVLTNDYECAMYENDEVYVPVVHKMARLPENVRLREIVAKMCGREELKQGTCEVNRYMNNEDNPNLCGVGFHGDRESAGPREEDGTCKGGVVWGVRLGCENVPLSFQWFTRDQPIGQRFCLEKLPSGTLYFMSRKAVGSDYKKSSQYTLRHAAGGPRYAPSNLSLQQKFDARQKKRQEKDAEKSQGNTESKDKKRKSNVEQKIGEQKIAEHKRQKKDTQSSNSQRRKSNLAEQHSIKRQKVASEVMKLFADTNNIAHAVVGPDGCICVVRWQKNLHQFQFQVWNGTCTELRGEYCSVLSCRALASTPHGFCALDPTETVTLFDTRGRVRRRWSCHSLFGYAMTVNGNWVYILRRLTPNFTVCVYDVRNGQLQHSFDLDSRFRFFTSMTIIADELFLTREGPEGLYVCVFSTTDGSFLRKWECGGGGWQSNVNTCSFNVTCSSDMTCSASGHLWVVDTDTKFTCFRPDGTRCVPYPQRLPHEKPTVLLSDGHRDGGLYGGLFKICMC